MSSFFLSAPIYGAEQQGVEVSWNAGVDWYPVDVTPETRWFKPGSTRLTSDCVLGALAAAVNSEAHKPGTIAVQTHWPTTTDLYYTRAGLKFSAFSTGTTPPLLRWTSALPREILGRYDSADYTIKHTTLDPEPFGGSVARVFSPIEYYPFHGRFQVREVGVSVPNSPGAVVSRVGPSRQHWDIKLAGIEGAQITRFWMGHSGILQRVTDRVPVVSAYEENWPLEGWWERANERCYLLYEDEPYFVYCISTEFLASIKAGLELTGGSVPIYTMSFELTEYSA